MIFFRKKKPVLDIGQLAEAISIHADIDFRKLWELHKSEFQGNIEYYTEPTFSVHICENVKVLVKKLHCCYSADCFGLGHYSYCMKLQIIIHDIACCVYEVSLPISLTSIFWDGTKFMRRPKHFYRKWNISNAEIIHDIPKQFIEDCNRWSLQIILEKNELRKVREKEKKQQNREKYEKEEQILSKYR